MSTAKGRVMTFEEKLEEENQYGGMTRRGFYFGAEWARQETLREIKPIIELAIDDLKFLGRHESVELLMRMKSKLEAEREE